MIAFQPFISLFFGNELLLEKSYVVALSVNVFFTMQFENVWNFRSTKGNFSYDRLYMILSAVFNMICSIFFVIKLGVVGVVIGTIIGFIFIAYGRVKFVFNIILNKPIIPYIKKHIAISSAMFIEWYIIVSFIEWINISNTYIDIIVNCIVSLLLYSIFQFVLFYHNDNFRYGLKYFNEFKLLVFNKMIK